MRLRKTLSAALVAGLLIAGLSSCSLLNKLFGSGEAAIVSFSLEGLVGTAIIDASKRTITATVEPVDLSKVTPDIGVSEGASIDSPQLVDGQPVKFTVTAQNGDTQTWTITVAVEPGISFTLDGNRVVLTQGLEDSNGQYDASIGSNVPVAGWDTNNQRMYFFASSTGWDVYYSSGDQSGNSPANMYIYLYGDTAATYTSADLTATYEDDSQSYFESNQGEAAGQTISIVLAQVGDVGDLVIGTFSGWFKNDSTASNYQVKNGYIKVKRVDDDVSFNPYS